MFVFHKYLIIFRKYVDGFCNKECHEFKFKLFHSLRYYKCTDNNWIKK